MYENVEINEFNSKTTIYRLFDMKFVQTLNLN